jgi:CDGSH-type Zn-finger protein
MVTIKALENGPFEVAEDGGGSLNLTGVAPRHPKGKLFLCRCGASANKPFCDGGHAKIGFKATEACIVGTEDKPGK